MSQNPKDSIPLTQQAPFRAVRDSAIIKDSENTFCKIKGLPPELVKTIRKTPQNCGHGSPHLSSARPQSSSIINVGNRGHSGIHANEKLIQGRQATVRDPFSNGYLQGMHWAVEP